MLETASNILNDFHKSFNIEKSFFNDLKTSAEEELVFINSKYLRPFLEYLKNNKRILIIFFKYGKLVDSKSLYHEMCESALNTVFSRFNIDRKTQHYMLMFYMNGIFSIVSEWIRNECVDDIEYIEKVIIDCVRPVIRK